MNQPTALAVQDLHYAYPDGQMALRGVSFVIQPGETVGLIGSNGAGKSTLLLHLSGLLQPSSGQVCVNGLTVNATNLLAVRRQVGLVFQDPDDQLFMPTVQEDVAFGPTNLGLPAHEVQTRVTQALATVGASHLSSRAPYRLSGGEKRMVAIAGVLTMAPKLLVLDEPSAALDPAARRRLINLLAGCALTQLIASHDLDLVQDLCSRVLVMREGIIEADGAPEAIFADAALLAHCHLEPPLSLQCRI
ncbi:energy-coupling factor ABC transporter ATP-binding protein [Rhodoferax sp.]|uniref:energy-coupling factor ABC transporter ATP-binding protein n=1 Tax=Rhodoferax sp. TaxID=50421 RepID=UPI001A0BA6B6|nr:energy-coupling factor ABC transporter ATP-binding protein [Rhodoferax sp.]MBE0472932.1 energy-coupling factor ABC transporter ATP-binding protein [Rhodoferax sp.]